MGVDKSVSGRRWLIAIAVICGALLAAATGYTALVSYFQDATSGLYSLTVPCGLERSGRA